MSEEKVYLVTYGSRDDGDPWGVAGIYYTKEQAFGELSELSDPGCQVEEWTVGTRPCKDVLSNGRVLENHTKTFGQLLTDFRVRKGIGQREFSRKIGIPQTELCQIENDRVEHLPPPVTFEKILRILQLNTEFENQLVAAWTANPYPSKDRIRQLTSDVDCITYAKHGSSLVPQTVVEEVNLARKIIRETNRRS